MENKRIEEYNDVIEYYKCITDIFLHTYPKMYYSE